MSVVFVPFDRSQAEVARRPDGLALHPDWWEVALGSPEANYLKRVRGGGGRGTLSLPLTFLSSSQRFYVTSIPCVMVCDRRSGKLITRDGRKAVEEEEEEENDDEDSAAFAKRVLDRWRREDWTSL